MLRTTRLEKGLTKPLSLQAHDYQSHFQCRSMSAKCYLHCRILQSLGCM